jgi:hypothetical protein
MKAAVYYPYLRVQTRGLMKHALLFWDHLEVITPFDHAEFPDDKELAAATEILVKPCVPSSVQKQEAHDQLMALISRPLPSWFYFGSEQPKEWIYADKFLPKTWHELRERGLASVQQGIGRQDLRVSNKCIMPSLAIGGDGAQYWSSEAFSMLMMSILADCCAGKTKVTATDQSDAFNTLAKCLAVESDAEARATRVGERALVSTEVLTPSLDKIPLKNLLNLRKKELGRNGHQYRQLRHKLFEKLTEFSEEQVKPEYGESDREELRRQFVDSFNTDFAELRNELRLAGRGWTFSTEFAALTATVGGAFAIGMTGGLAGIPLALGATIPLIRMTDKYKAARFKALQGHFSAYLYLAEHAQLEADAF